MFGAMDTSEAKDNRFSCQLLIDKLHRYADESKENLCRIWPSWRQALNEITFNGGMDRLTKFIGAAENFLESPSSQTWEIVCAESSVIRPRPYGGIDT